MPRIDARPLLRRLLTHSLTLKKRTESEIDSLWGTSSSSFTSYSVKGALHPLTLEEIRWLSVAGLPVGDARALLFKEYEVSGQTIKPEVGDYLSRDGEEYEILRIREFTEMGTTILEAILRRRG